MHNFPILSESLSHESPPYCERGSIIAFVGGITVIQGIKEMISAVALLPECLGAKLVLAGTFDPPELEAEVRQMPGWGERVVFLGQQQKDGVMQLLHKARVGIVVYPPTPNYLEGYPAKLFEYMASRIPVVLSDFPIWRQIVRGVDCGLFVNPLDPKAIAAAIQWLLTHPEEAAAMGKRGEEAVQSRYSWDTEATKLASLYTRIVR